MIVKPSVSELLTKAKNRYELVIATARRARQISLGDEALTNVDEESAVTLAANEIAEDKVIIISDDSEIKEETENNEILDRLDFIKKEEVEKEEGEDNE